MTDLQITIQLLTFCGYQEMPRTVNPDGSFGYIDDIQPLPAEFPYSKLRTSYKIISDSICVVDTNDEWYFLKPEGSLDHCAYLVSRIHAEIHVHMDNVYMPDMERQPYQRLHESLMGVYTMFQTLSPQKVMSGLGMFLHQATMLLPQR